MLALTVVNKMLTLTKNTQIKVLIPKLLNSKLSKINMLCITDMLCGTCTYTSRCRIHDVGTLHIENPVEILDGNHVDWYTPGCSYSKKVINYCWSHGWW
jgi:hypothetical protein